MLVIDKLQVYYGESRILNEVDIQVPPGQVVCLMGRNGVGKTTLLKAIMGVLRSRGGSITYDNQNITRAPAHKRARAGIGYVPQGRGIFPYLTVKENMLMGLEALTARELKAGYDAIEEIYTTFPVLKAMEKRAAGTLSGGQQQQLALGRVLIRRPRLLLLDEPTEGIQPNIVEEIEALIISLGKRGDMAILLVEQFLDFAMNVADYCYVMEKGHIVAEGKREVLPEGRIREYLAV
ncbi:MAG: urea ABC transporter ATP-binding subunit UrtE [Anaerolinea sp.]|nr:urea ABC transporter ATP-binding subunit UrtE [Anaerolinea sp.]MCC6973454.1 urea ABC transporter ATP-binding subunit UrtE [Anaerolineae bacterium]CAG1005355.1 High-affinity branched-chain amino acid transport ATP-binding protein LivF [Anaerolineae bacterium]